AFWPSYNSRTRRVTLTCPLLGLLCHRELNARPIRHLTSARSLSLSHHFSVLLGFHHCVSLSPVGFAEEKLYLLVAKAQKDDHSTTAAASDYYWF
ncbi:hypothetical protein TorRG33x02_095430, partial [Trema orientale]